MQSMGAGGSGSSGGSPSVFLPPNQGAAAETWGNLLGPLAGVAGNAGAGTPGAWAYPQSQSLYPTGYNQVSQFLTGSPYGPTLYDQNMGTAVGSATNAYNNFLPTYGAVTGAIPGFVGGATAGMPYLPQTLENAFSPYYGTMVQAAADNPLYPQAMTGASQAAAYGGQGAQDMMTQARALMMSGFDPQAGLYNRGQQQLLDKSNAVNAMSGLSGPYAAGVTSNALGNYEINWQNQQLGRQAQAAQASSPLFTGATNLAYGSAQMPNQVYMKQISDVLAALEAQNRAGQSGVSSYGGMIDAIGRGLQGGLGLGTTGAQGLTSIGGAPYSTGATIANNSLSGLGNLNSMLTSSTAMGNQQYTLPIEVMNQLAKYMGLGQTASGINNQLGQSAFNQQASGIGGLLSGANMLFNPTSGWFPGAIGGLMGLFGSDRRLKRDIERIGRLRNGLPVYRFRYHWSGRSTIGLMADEVERVHPRAVAAGPGGFKMVNYALAVG